MRYKNSDDNRYRVQFMRSTEELMDQLTVKEFISYLEENAEFEDYTVEYIDKKCVKCRAYDLTEENSKLHKEFLVTEDGRVFYWRSLISKIELVDAEEEKQEVQEVVVDFREANMTDEQRSFYLLLCMTGRTQEVTEYREKIEKQEDNTDGENIQE